jgi:hypothetical protein
MHQPFQGDLFVRGDAFAKEQPGMETAATGRIYVFPPCRNTRLVAKLPA